MEKTEGLLVSSGYIHVPAEVLVPRCPSTERGGVPVEPKGGLYPLCCQTTSVTSGLAPKAMFSIDWKTSPSFRETRTNT